MQSRSDFDHELLSAFLDYNPESGLLHWKHSVGKAKKGNQAGNVHNGYRKITFMGRGYSAHRVAWAIHYKSPPPDVVDHIDGDGLNNSIINLRDGTDCKNQQNQKQAHVRNKTSSRIGVSKLKGRWRAKIYHKGKYFFLGYHPTEDAAAEAYLSAKRRLHEGCTI